MRQLERPTMSKQPRPMLAAKYERTITEQHLIEDGFLLMQPKVDGMRVLFDDGVARSRSWKPWTNVYLQNFAKSPLFKDRIHGWDGEMLPGLLDTTNPDPEDFRRAMSGLRSQEGSSQMTYFLFDNWDESFMRTSYQNRQTAIIQDVREAAEQLPSDVWQHGYDGLVFEQLAPLGTMKMFEVKVVLCPTKPVYSIEEVEQTHLEFVAAGWEGSIVRRRKAPYKWNRATSREGWLTKMKDFEDDEAIIEGWEPAYANNNEATVSPLGYTARSAHKANLVAKDYLGAFQVRLRKNPEVRFSIGVLKGYTLEDRRQMLREIDSYIGRIIKFTHQGYAGGYDAPRTPVGIGFRDPIDL